MDTQILLLKLEGLYLVYGYPLVFVSSFVETSPLGWSIPGGLILAVGGFFAYSGHIALFGVLVAGWLGQWLTFLLAYYLGFKGGYFLVKKLHQNKTAQKAKTLLERNGGVILTTSMLSNLTRFWVAYIAGIQNYNIIKFLFYSGAASLTWTSLMTMAGYITGGQRQQLEKFLTGLGFLSWILLGLVIFLIYNTNKKDFNRFQQKQ